MRKITIAANWKEYLNEDQSVKLIKKLDNFFISRIFNHQFMIFPSESNLKGILDALEQRHKDFLSIGLQDPSYDSGHFELSTCIVGHSDRRIKHKEDNDEVKRKFNIVYHNSNVYPVLCVGETENEKKEGLTLEIIKNQIPKNVFNSKNLKNNFAIAYEPVWSIGTGKVPTNNEIKTVLESIKSQTNKSIRLFYGGSVDKNNVEKLLEIDLIDGFLIGGASTKFESLVGIIEKVDKFLKKTN